jgi:tRNA (guanine-N7-)-methyltransferase
LSRVKLKRFGLNDVLSNVIQPGKESFTTIKGRWHEVQFNNQNPIVLEVGCGKGEYSTGLAEAFPNKNFVGIDIKGGRIWVGADYAMQNNLHNVAFIRTRIQNLDDFFEPGEVSEIWITFPDPRPKLSDIRRRLTCPRFLKMYQRLIGNHGIVHLKTDDTDLFNYSMDVLQQSGQEILEQTTDLYASPFAEQHLGIRTYFEKKFMAMGRKINYAKFRLGEEMTL